jgi:hypothetical protein
MKKLLYLIPFFGLKKWGKALENNEIDIGFWYFAPPLINAVCIVGICGFLIFLINKHI